MHGIFLGVCGSATLLAIGETKGVSSRKGCRIGSANWFRTLGNKLRIGTKEIIIIAQSDCKRAKNVQKFGKFWKF